MTEYKYSKEVFPRWTKKEFDEEILFKKKHLSELKSKIIEINKNQSIGFPKIEKKP